MANVTTDTTALTPWDELGWPKARVNPPTKAEVRAAYQALLLPDLKPIIEAQKARAMGLKHLVVREADGKFKRISADDLATLDAGAVVEVWERDPDQKAIDTILAYCLDKPKEQPQEVEYTGLVQFAWKQEE